MRCASCDVQIRPDDLCGWDGLRYFCRRCGATRPAPKGQSLSASRPKPTPEQQAEFHEVFRNLYATGFSFRVLLVTIFQVICGLLFSAGLLVTACVLGLAWVYLIFGLDPFPQLDIKSRLADFHLSISSFIGAIIGTLIALAFWAYLGPHTLIRVKRRLAARRYVLANRPLATVEGQPTFDSGSEVIMGVEVGEFYFSFEDCWPKFVEGEDMEKLERAGGVLRIWYIPKDLRASKDPRTGEVIKHNGIPVYAEWRPLI